MSDMETRASVIFGVCRNDPQRWREFDATYRPILRAYLRKRGVQESDAGEVVQEIFIRLVNKIGTYDRTRCRFRTWLFRIAMNTLIDFIRRQACYDKALKGWADTKLREIETHSDEMEKEWEKIHRERILRRALRVVHSRVSSRAWKCFVGRMIDNRPAEEIARELGIDTPNAVYVNACRVLKKIRTLCEEFDEDLSQGSEISLS